MFEEFNSSAFAEYGGRAQFKTKAAKITHNIFLTVFIPLVLMIKQENVNRIKGYYSLFNGCFLFF